MDATDSDFVVHSKPPTPFDLLLTNVSYDLSGEVLTCEVMPAVRTHTKYRYRQDLIVIRNHHSPNIHRGGDVIHQGDLATIACLSSTLQANMTLFINDQKVECCGPLSRSLSRGFDRATGYSSLRYHFDPAMQHRLHGDMMRVECVADEDGHWKTDYALFLLIPQLGGLMELQYQDEMVLMSSGATMAPSVIGTSLLLGATAVCLWV